MTTIARWARRVGIGLLVAVSRSAAQAPTAPPASGLLSRRYELGQAIAYHMTATNKSHTREIRYQADVTGEVARDSAGHFIETLHWSGLVQNDERQELTTGNLQRLGFAPGFLLPPDLAHTDPRLTGPVLDLFTFYVDLWLAARSPALTLQGDQIRVPGRGSNSWADGTNVLIGSDAIDFVVTLSTVDSARHIATLRVRHVAPDSGRVALPADWMRPPVADTPNNWVQVESMGDKFVASVGKETFDVELTVDLATGGIMTATMDNPVDVIERTCTDRALTHCDAPVRYQILRRIALEQIKR